jgi:formylglycine-generating enzyme required for sulfatase activity
MKQPRISGNDNGTKVLEPFASPDPLCFVWIQPGVFTLGSPPNQVDKDSDESPQTTVSLTRGFWMSKHPTTQEEYLAVTGSNPSYFRGTLKRPVEQVGWNEAVEYCSKETSRLQNAGRLPAGYECRLPTEAEWEYACRAGSGTKFGHGDDYGKLGDYAWFAGNSGKMTQPVEKKLPNAWGLYDMHGNVWEWCLDWYSEALPGGRVADPQGQAEGLRRVNRGGCWSSIGWYCRSSTRFYVWATGKMNGLGFRPVIAPSRTH